VNGDRSGGTIDHTGAAFHASRRIDDLWAVVTHGKDMMGANRDAQRTAVAFLGI
jgi:hypothetical protein